MNGSSQHIGEDGIEPLPEGLAEGLSVPMDPTATGSVQHLQTHISTLHLTPNRVYKMRKAVSLRFLSFATRDERNADCLREVALNRRLAPDVYLGVAPLRLRCSGSQQGQKRWEVGPVGEELAKPDALGRVPEHCVVMRRLPSGRDGQSLLEAGLLDEYGIDDVARCIASFHRAACLGAPAPFSEEKWRDAHVAPFLDSLADVQREADGAGLSGRSTALSNRARDRLDDLERVFECRRQRGRGVDGHGDLQLAHVWIESGKKAPLIIDCTEFNESFRRIDAASDLAFLSMDLRYRGRPDLAERLLSTYAAESDDFELYRVIDWFESYRAVVRCKVAVLAAHDAAIDSRQRAAARQSACDHLSLAARCLAPRGIGRLVLVCGSIGTGKSSVARRLALQLGAAVVSSDLTRKHLAGLEAGNHRYAGAPARSGIYNDTMSDLVYAGLEERARPVLESGRCAVLDATFSSTERREHVSRWAAAMGSSPWLIEVRCSEPVARERVSQRAAHGRDESDAGTELIPWSIERFEPPDEWRSALHLVVRTDEATWEEDLERRVVPLVAASSCSTMDRVTRSAR